MSDLHDSVHAFADGELDPPEAEAFREHLGTCEQCQAELEDILQLQALGTRLAEHEAPLARPPEPMAPRSRAFRPAWRSRAVRAMVLGGSLAAAVSLALLGTSSLETAGPLPTEVLALAPTRAMEARLAYGGAAGYRPYAVKRSGDERPRELVPMKTLARLEEARDFHGLAAGALLGGDPDRAAEYLRQAGASPDVVSDRAVLALSKGELEEALVILEGILEKQPKHPQALWNRALVLRELELDLMAAESFRQVEALHEPGWSDEARERAAAVEQQTRERQRRWQATWEACKALADKGTPLPEGMVRTAPSLVRKYLYLAAWSAPSAERVRALLPIAKELDGIYNGDVLQRYVERTAKRDFQRRGPLASTFAEVLAGRLPPDQAEPYVRALRAAGEQDILLGALVLLNQLPARLQDYEAAVRSVGDPWFVANVEIQRALGQFSAGELSLAETTLLMALPACEQQRLDYRCGEMESLLTKVYITQHRLAEARGHALRGLSQARSMGDAGLENQFIERLGWMARFRNAFALTRAYLGESALRQPDYCPSQVYMHESLANVRMFELRPDEARAELDRIPDCGAQPSLLSAGALADLVRMAPRPGDAERVLGLLSTLRAAKNLQPGMSLLLDHLEGRVRVTHDRTTGRRLLRQVITAADALPHEDTSAEKARTASYSELILDAGKAGEYAEALALFAEELHASAPSRCALGLELADERTLLVARGAAGDVVGTYDSSRRTPDFDVERLVPVPVLEALRPCEHVDVFARYPLHGRAGLLPPSFAWSYRSGPEHALVAGTGELRRLVVSDVAAPSSLNLPRLTPWSPSRSTGREVELTGPSATPSRVVAEMADADEIDIHAHGLVNLGLSDASLIVLAPETDGAYALTASQVRHHRLKHAPVVVLASCRAAYTAPFLHEPWSLPNAFLAAGARAVIASPTDIPDEQAGPFFEAVRARIRAGESPAVAVRNERTAFLAKDAQSWVRTVIVFE
ncbi:CHAT domain-containing protein [Vitiosangium sp. GDMCC 1.1324]|uniref:CHAT domain-containing protein n=1 Tax=Vitiosangium sp. (strain GDMCC 1.1324) TaxID=2138576 RepID=UPI000D3A52FB|nr:CHAT domain-containing protein [Vitiosangium sp. GDMCC 1.1324]PTL81085.1 hypothetical protein DAT35_23420 [Vitiosangium sp. GDMCC 1.1324]